MGKIKNLAIRAADWMGAYYQQHGDKCENCPGKQFYHEEGADYCRYADEGLIMQCPALPLYFKRLK